MGSGPLAPPWNVPASSPRQPRYCEAVIIGIGFPGLLVAIGLQKRHCNDFVLLERSAELGGTWQINSYPRAEVGIPLPHDLPGWRVSAGRR
jgi:cation diffusion facilitator CzcD-associated flavoprotein CzcO